MQVHLLSVPGIDRGRVLLGNGPVLGRYTVFLRGVLHVHSVRGLGASITRSQEPGGRQSRNSEEAIRSDLRREMGTLNHLSNSGPHRPWTAPAALSLFPSPSPAPTTP